KADQPVFELHVCARSADHWWSWSGSNRRPPECKSGALPAELQPQTLRPRSSSLLGPSIQSRPVGCRDAGIQSLAALKRFVELQVEIARRAPQLSRRRTECLEWNGCSLLAHAVHSNAVAFENSTHGLS